MFEIHAQDVARQPHNNLPRVSEGRFSRSHSLTRSKCRWHCSICQIRHVICAFWENVYIYTHMYAWYSRDVYLRIVLSFFWKWKEDTPREESSIHSIDRAPRGASSYDIERACATPFNAEWGDVLFVRRALVRLVVRGRAAAVNDNTVALVLSIEQQDYVHGTSTLFIFVKNDEEEIL